MKFYQKPKSLACVDRGDLTLLSFQSCEIDKSQGDLSTNVDDNKSFTSRPSDLQNHALALVLSTFKNNKSNRFSRYIINAVALFSTGLTVDL